MAGGTGDIPTAIVALVVGYVVFLEALVLFAGWLGPIRTGWKDLTTSYLHSDFEGARVWNRQYVRIQKRGLSGEYFNASVGAGRNGLQVQIMLAVYPETCQEFGLPFRRADSLGRNHR